MRTGDVISGDMDNGLLAQDTGPDFRHIPEDTVSLCGVGGEMDVPNELRQRRPIPRSTAGPNVGLGVVHTAPDTATSMCRSLLYVYMYTIL